MQHRPAMGIDAECCGDPEIIVGLHDLGGKAQWVQRGNDRRPPHSGTDPAGQGGTVQFERAPGKGQGQTVARDRLPAHRMPRRPDVDRPPGRRRVFQRLPQRRQLIVGCGLVQNGVAEHRGFAQPAGVIQQMRVGAWHHRDNPGHRRAAGHEGTGRQPADHRAGSQQQGAAGQVAHGSHQPVIKEKRLAYRHLNLRHVRMGRVQQDIHLSPYDLTGHRQPKRPLPHTPPAPHRPTVSYPIAFRQ